MTLQINCSMCNGHLKPDTLAIRRRIIVCSYCSTINRIAKTGTEKIDGQIREDYISPSLNFEGEKSKTIAIDIKKRELAPSYYDGERILKTFSPLIPVASFIAYSIIFMTLFCLMYPPFLIILFGYVLFIGIVSLGIITISMIGFLRPVPVPPLKISNEVIVPALPKASPIKLSEIRQIFTTDTHLYFPIGRYKWSRHYSTVFALTHGGERRPLAGPLKRDSVALHIEELIEVDINLFDLPVHGSAQMVDIPAPKQQLLDTSQSLVDEFDCYSCGALLQSNPSIVRQGYVVCAYCHSLTLLYRPDSLPVLGLPTPHATHLQLKLQKNGNRVFLMRRFTDSHEQQLTIDPEVVIQQKGDPKITVLKNEIVRVLVREHHKKDWVRPTGFEYIVKNYVRAITNNHLFSGEINVRQVFAKARLIVTYQIFLQKNSGEKILLLQKLRDVREAVMWAELICDKCGVDNEETHHLLG